MHDCMALHCTEPFIILLPSSPYDLNNVERDIRHQGQVVQSFISLTSLLVIKMLTVLVSTISNLQVFLLKKCEYAKVTHIFSAKILEDMPYLMIKVLTIRYLMTSLVLNN